MTHILVFLLAFGASVVGAVCGIGGGVIIKPLLDALGIAGASQISFLSGCTVLSMSCYSVIWAMAAKESLVKFDTGTPLAIGAAIGGIAGKSLFSALTASVERQETVGGYQAVYLTIMTGATFLYTINKSRIQTLHIKDTWICILVGLALGMMSSFLGIGGGPINLVVLYFFFSMGIKAAAQNSLYIILVSQVTSLLTSLITNSVPPVRASWLLQMVSGGIGGGGRGSQGEKSIRGFCRRICCYIAWRKLLEYTFRIPFKAIDKGGVNLSIIIKKFLEVFKWDSEDIRPQRYAAKTIKNSKRYCSRTAPFHEWKLPKSLM